MDDQYEAFCIASSNPAEAGQLLADVIVIRQETDRPVEEAWLAAAGIAGTSTWSGEMNNG